MNPDTLRWRGPMPLPNWLRRELRPCIEPGCERMTTSKGTRKCKHCAKKGHNSSDVMAARARLGGAAMAHKAGRRPA